MDRLDESDLVELEQTWIAAETEADLAKDLAERAAIAAKELEQTADTAQPDIKLLIDQAASYQQRRARAEADAIAAFDRFWSAKSNK